MPRPILEPLDIMCTETDCENNFHCFRSNKKLKARNMAGRCRDCGADLVDWSRVGKRDLKDVTYTIQALEYELIRHHFWHVRMDVRAINYARKKGWLKLEQAVEHRIRKSVSVKTAFDGRQTKKEGNPIHYAQHATATCCRVCIEEWHDIPQDQPLTEEQIGYMSELCMLYLKQQLPLFAQVTEYGEKVPPIRKGKK